MSGRPFDAAVIGAGPAGSAAAAALARAGRRVLLIEKDQFPRPKVCGEFLSARALPALERIGARELVERASPERISEGALHLPGAVPVAFRLPEPALGISRRLLDNLLAQHALAAGAEVSFATRAVSVDGSRGAFRVRLARSAEEEEDVEAAAVIGAWGRWDALDRTLRRGFLRGRARFFGFSRDFAGRTEALAGRVCLYIFAGGYCGLSRVEGGAVNLAGVVSEKRKRALGGWSEVVEHARRSNPHLDAALSPLEPGPVGFLGTGPVFFTAKPPVERGMLLAGDAAGVLDPFSGEGQAAALASGLLAAETALQFLEGTLSAADLPKAYARAWRRRFAQPFAWSALFRPMLLHPAAGRWAGRVAGPRLVRLAMKHVGA